MHPFAPRTHGGVARSSSVTDLPVTENSQEAAHVQIDHWIRIPSNLHRFAPRTRGGVVRSSSFTPRTRGGVVRSSSVSDISNNNRMHIELHLSREDYAMTCSAWHDPTFALRARGGCSARVAHHDRIGARARCAPRSHRRTAGRATQESSL